MIAPVLRRRFTVDDYYQMADSGIIAAHESLELIDGEIVQMSPMGALHAECVSTIADLLTHAVGPNGRVRTKCPVRLSVLTEPEPDVAIVRRRSYRSAHPSATDIYLLIEVADTSLDYDQGVKAPLYAREGVAELWLVNLGGEAVERHTEPTAEGYRDVAIYRRGDLIVSRAIPAVTIMVDAVLGEAPPA